MRAAALDLYAEQGYEATTTAQIAERAGVTERTYFRHFADKREVLFGGEEELLATLTGAIADASAELTGLGVVQEALVAAVPLFVAGRPIAERRAPIIAASPALRERAHAKSAALTEAMSGALERRGTPAPTARLAAPVGLAAFSRASAEWAGRSGTELEGCIRDAFAELRALSG